MKTHLQHAEEKLTDSAGEVNERLTDARVRLQRLKERRGERENFNEGEENGARQQGDTDDWEERLRELEERVEGATERLEGQMRGTIDGEVRVDGLVGVLGTIEREVEQESSFGRSTRSTRSTRTTRRRGGEEDGDDDEEDGDYEEAEEERGEESVPPSRRLDKLLGENYADWDKLSLTERYVWGGFFLLLFFFAFGELIDDEADWDVYTPGTRPITPTLGSIGLFTKRNTPAKIFLHYRMHRRGSHIWKIQLRVRRNWPILRPGARVVGDLLPRRTQMRSPSRASAYRSSALLLYFTSGTL